MDRIEYIKIEDKEYPLCCTLGAMEELSDTYGGAQAFIKKIGQATEYGAYLKTLSVFMKYGSARLKRTEENVPEPLTIDDLRVILDTDNYPDVINAIVNCLKKAQKNEVKGKPNGKKKETT